MQNQPNPIQSPSQPLGKLWQSLNTGWRTFARFMVHPETSSLGDQGRPYPYLPASQGQRHWLDKIYRQS
ncbi:MAG: hypothetical protein AAGC54_12000 [Cyanobacteria bacterium P01_F01_bin.4]